MVADPKIGDPLLVAEEGNRKVGTDREGRQTVRVKVRRARIGFGVFHAGRAAGTALRHEVAATAGERIGSGQRGKLPVKIALDAERIAGSRIAMGIAATRNIEI